MSVLIKDMEKPEFCYVEKDGKTEYCPFVNTNDDCVLLLKKGICEVSWEDQYNECPLVDLPSARDMALEELAAAVRQIAEKLKAQEEPETVGWTRDESGEVKCRKCGSYTKKITKYCPECGARMFKDKVTEEILC